MSKILVVEDDRATRHLERSLENLGAKPKTSAARGRKSAGRPKAAGSRTASGKRPPRAGRGGS